MKTPDRFILAFPFEGHKYIHYKCYWVDLKSGVIVRTMSRHDLNVGGLSFHMEWPDRSDSVLHKRIVGKPLYACGNTVVTDGVLRDVHWRGRNFEQERNDCGNYPIRFQPVVVNFASHCVTGEFLKNEAKFVEIEAEIDDVLRKLCSDDRFWYSDNRCILTIKPQKIGCVADVLTKAFHAMSFSQIVVSTKSLHQDCSKTRRLLDVYNREIPRFHLSNFVANLDLVYPPKTRETPKTLKHLKARCAARFVRRHPTRATTILLKMMAANFKL